MSESNDSWAVRAIMEVDKVMLHVAGHWPDVETDAMMVRHVKQLTRMHNADWAEVQALREAVRRAWMTDTEDFRRFYDAELFKVLGISSFQDLYKHAGT